MRKERIRKDVRYQNRTEVTLGCRLNDAIKGHFCFSYESSYTKKAPPFGGTPQHIHYIKHFEICKEILSTFTKFCVLHKKLL